uniref:Calmodulin binding transcription activator 1 n=1 Tax=Capra hircus TaxID=9925 RepID=A0A8C2RR23_CAPHI
MCGISLHGLLCWGPPEIDHGLLDQIQGSEIYSGTLGDDHGNSNSSHVKIFLPKKLLECLPKCSSLPKERHRWNTNEALTTHLFMGAARRGSHRAGAGRAAPGVRAGRAHRESAAILPAPCLASRQFC